MKQRSGLAWAAATVLGMTLMAAGAAAQTVPMPHPAPLARGAKSKAPANPHRSGLGALAEIAPNPAPPSLRPQAAPATGTIDAGQRALVERVNSYLSSVRSLVGNFVQIGPDRTRTEGSFYLQKPGRVRFEYDPPSPIELIADGKSVVVRDRHLATQDLYPLSQTPLRFLLADRIDLLRDTHVIGAYADDTFITVVIEEQQTIGGSNRLMMMFGAQDNQLKQWTITDAQGYDTTVAVYNLDSTKKIDPSLFKINYERMLQ